MPYDPVFVITLSVLVLKTRISEEEIAGVISASFGAYAGYRPPHMLQLWSLILGDLPEWPDTVFKYPDGHALVRDVFSWVHDGYPKFRTFPYVVQAGTPCTDENVDEVRAWMRSAGRPGTL